MILERSTVFETHSYENRAATVQVLSAAFICFCFFSH